MASVPPCSQLDGDESMKRGWCAKYDSSQANQINLIRIDDDYLVGDADHTGPCLILNIEAISHDLNERYDREDYTYRASGEPPHGIRSMYSS